MKVIDLTEAELQRWIARHSEYGKAAAAYADATRALWGARIAPLMSPQGAKGRFAGAKVSCPPRACSGYLEFEAGAGSLPYRNPDAIENLVILDGEFEVTWGNGEGVRLSRFDMISIPSDLVHSVRNVSAAPARLFVALNGAVESTYPAVFASRPDHAVPEQALRALNVEFDGAPGRVVGREEMQARITRFDKLVPYKSSLNKANAIPRECTEWLTASSVYSLIVPEKHVGRSQYAPVRGFPGLYLAIAECTPGDGPLPHAHADTQESFFVLDGQWDISWGMNGERAIPVKQHDLVAMPERVMRAFRNTGEETARLLVIIQGGDPMSDLVAYSPEVGQEVRQRFGPQVIDAYKNVHITFDAHV